MIIFAKTRTFRSFTNSCPDHLRSANSSCFLWFGIVCQTVSSEKLRCPAKSASDQTPADVYSVFLENFEKFKELNALPVDVDYGEHGIVQAFVQHNASWHKQCHQKYNNSMLERARQRQIRKRKSAEGEATNRSKCKKILTVFIVVTQLLSHYCMSSLPLIWIDG